MITVTIPSWVVLSFGALWVTFTIVHIVLDIVLRRIKRKIEALEEAK